MKQIRHGFLNPWKLLPLEIPRSTASFSRNDFSPTHGFVGTSFHRMTSPNVIRLNHPLSELSNQRNFIIPSVIFSNRCLVERLFLYSSFRGTSFSQIAALSRTSFPKTSLSRTSFPRKRIAANAISPVI